MRALVVHPGTQHSFYLAVELNRLKSLACLHTGFAVASGGALERICNFLPAHWQRRIANRRIEELPHQLVCLQPLFEWMALTRISYGADAQRVLHWRNETFQRRIPRRAIEGADVVIGFDTSSWVLTERCRDLGKPLVIIQTTCHPDTKRNIHEQVRAKFPDWIETSERRLSQVRLAEQQEHDSATLIVASSSFTRQTLVQNGVSPSKIRIIPHGVDCDRFSPRPVRGARPFRFVFAGAINATKGVPLLLEAWRQLQPPNAELWLIGPASHQVKSLLPSLRGLHHLGSVPQLELPVIMSSCDVFVFPSYFEGFGLVILQAMACGLPIITTSTTAGPDLFRDDKAGWIIPPNDEVQLIKAMNHCLEHPDEMHAAGRRARAIAEQFNSHKYAKSWAGLLAEVGTLGDRTTATAKKLRDSRCFAGAATTAAKMRPRALLVHPGTQHSQRLAMQLHSQGCLIRFWTGFAVSSEGFEGRVLRMLPASMRQKLGNRIIKDLPPAKLRTRPLTELAALYRLNQGCLPESVMYERNRVFQSLIPDREILNSDVVIGFDTSSAVLAARASRLGRSLILDQTTPHPQSKMKIYQLLQREFPDWSENLVPRLPSVLTDEETEYSKASHIVVASSFTRSSLVDHGVPDTKIIVNPYGVDLELFRAGRRPSSSSSHPLRFLFTGAITAPKGVPLLLQAWANLKARNAELWLAGRVSSGIAQNISKTDNVKLLGQIAYATLPELMNQCDVFVFPSYFEGFGRVLLEALASGLPVITTPATAGPDLIRNSEEGFLVPVGDAAALRDAMKRFFDMPNTLREMSAAARRRAEMFTWEAYGRRWLSILQGVLAGHG